MARAKKTVDDKVEKYLGIVSSYEKEFKKWESRAEKIGKRYRDDAERRTGTKFPMLWSNVQTLIPATFSRLPQPDVSRRFRDNDPVGRVASQILERALDFDIQHYPDYRATMKQSVLDRFLGGRGSAWARYEPHFKPGEAVQVSDDADADLDEQLDYECAPVDYVHYKDFGHTVARTWEEVGQVWRNVYMDEPDVEERFGKGIAKAIPYDASPEELKRAGKDDTTKKQAKIIELWDKSTCSAIWLSRSHKEPLDERKDPLGLEGFFPCPPPLFATLTNDTLIPVPDYTLYQDQANDLDELCARINGLVKALKVMGGYDASIPELARLFTEGENGTLVPVKNWAAFAEKNGLQGAISLVDLKPIVEALKAAFETFAQLIQFIYQITGISDIVRGQSDPNETLGAQELKGQFAAVRLKDMQNATAQYATGLLQLKAQIMCLKFNPQTIAQIAAVDQLSEADKQYVPQAMALLVGPQRMQDANADGKNPLRSFRIEVNADTLIQFDENAEKQNAVEFLTAVGGYMKSAAEVGQLAPTLIPLLMECLKWGVSRFKVGKSLEGTIDQAIDHLKQKAKQAEMQPPPPDPKVVAEQAKAQAVERKGQIDVAVAERKAGIEERKMHMEEQHDMRQGAIDAQNQQRDDQFAQQDAVRKQQIADATHANSMRKATMPPPARKQ